MKVPFNKSILCFYFPQGSLKKKVGILGLDLLTRDKIEFLVPLLSRTLWRMDYDLLSDLGSPVFLVMTVFFKVLPSLEVMERR